MTSCDLSRPTVKSYLEATAIAQALVPVRPFHGGSRREIVRRPKVYGFDTGFAAFARGWSSLRDEDRDPLWEHLVLDVLRARPARGTVGYWRDKSGREIDFVLSHGRTADAIECKVSPERFDPTSLRAFRLAFPRGRNLLVAQAWPIHTTHASESWSSTCSAASTCSTRANPKREPPPPLAPERRGPASLPA